MQTNRPLRYKISDLKQLSACKSNSSQDLSLSTTVFINDDRLHGTRVEVIHETFGVLYAYTLDASGTMMMQDDYYEETTILDILKELKRFGFLIDYDPVVELPEKQLQFLASLNILGFDKIRMIGVVDDTDKEHKTKNMVVLFKIKENPYWLNNNYCATKSEMERALYNGSAFNVYSVDEAKKYSWAWLAGFVADIEDVLKDNNGDLWRGRIDGQ